MSMLNAVLHFCLDDTGVTAVEYSLMAALISGAIITTLTLFGETVRGMWTQASETIVAVLLAAQL